MECEDFALKEKVKIVVATHKKYQMPEDKMYIPLHVGAAAKLDNDGNPLDLDYVKDDSGQNISSLNYRFGTQTGLYWLWKNVDSEYKGLVHYRRHFVGKHPNNKDMVGSAIKFEELKPLLKKYKVFTPKKRHYYIESLDSHYAHTHDGSHFRIVRDIIQKDCPEYLHAFDTVMKRTWGYMFNMMILKNELMDDYCSWLFNILFQVADSVDANTLSDFDSRFCGRISEILFDVWLEKKVEDSIVKKDEIKELPYMEQVNWKFKIKAFLAAKFLKQKYGKSS